MFRLLSQNEIDLVYTLDHHIYDRNYVIAYEVLFPAIFSVLQLILWHPGNLFL